MFARELCEQKLPLKPTGGFFENGQRLRLQVTLVDLRFFGRGVDIKDGRLDFIRIPAQSD